MIKILLSLTIWLRKYQGRGGNFYTICNAMSILVVIMLVPLFLVTNFVFSQNDLSIDKSKIGIIILLMSIIISSIIPYTLMYKLRKRNIYLHFKEYRQNVYSISFLGILLSIILLIMQF